jgi:hypothetical protein
MIIKKATEKDLDDLVKLDKLARKEIKWWISLSKREFMNL